MRCLDTEHGRIGTFGQPIRGVACLELREPDADPDSGVRLDRDADQVEPALRFGKVRAALGAAWTVTTMLLAATMTSQCTSSRLSSAWIVLTLSVQ